MTRLYSYFRSSSSYRVRLALNLKNLYYQIEPVHLLKEGGQQHKEPYKQLNAAGRVPLLEHEGDVVAQSMAIIEYLEDVQPEPSLLPKEPTARALVRQLCEIINCDIQPLQNLSVLQKLVNDHNFSDEEKQAWCQHWVSRGLHSFEKLLQRTHGQFCFQDQVSAADCFLIPQIYSAQRFGVDLSPFPLILEINERCLTLEPFIKAHPDNQPDTPS